MIKVEISHERWKHQPSQEEQQTLDKLINDLLEPIVIDCVTYNAKVEAVISLSENYLIRPVCDHYATLMAMQELLPTVIPKFS
jgi:hypothetical protein